MRWIAAIIVCMAMLAQASADEEPPYRELIERRLDGLLERAMEQSQAPEPLRWWLRAVYRLHALDSDAAAAQRRQAVDELMARTGDAGDDPYLLQLAVVDLLRHGAEQGVNTLEYWGENARTQAAVRPVVEKAITLLESASRAAQTRAAALAARMGNHPTPRQSANWMQLDALDTAAAYQSANARYAWCLSVDPADPLRKERAHAAIEYLERFDNPRSGVQPQVRSRIAKLRLAAGEADEAIALFRTLTEPEAALAPLPSVTQQYEAHFFSAVAELVARRFDAAEKHLIDLAAWQKIHLAADPKQLAGAEAAAQVLRYRLARAWGQPDALNILRDLATRRSDLQPAIYEHLLPRADGPPDRLDSLLLRAVVYRGELELHQEQGGFIDTRVIERSLAAARELATRRDAASDAEHAALLAGFFLEKLNRPFEAAEAFVDAMEHAPSIARDATQAAARLLASLQKDSANQRTQRLYERFLPLAIDKAGRLELAFEYGRQLQQQGEAGRAIIYFRRVPADDSRLAYARYFEALAQKNLNRQEKALQAAAEAHRLAAERRDNDLICRTALLSADTLRESDPAAALKHLADLETLAKGLADEKSLLADALLLRTLAHLASGQAAQAADAAASLLQSGEARTNLLHTLLNHLDADYERAADAADAPRMRQTAAAAARLGDQLVSWATGHADASVRAGADHYRVFAAIFHCRAARLQTDSARRQHELQAAVAMCRSYLAENPVAQPPSTTQPTESHVAQPPSAVQTTLVEFHCALALFDLGELRNAQAILSRLLADGKLGGPWNRVIENAQERQEENPRYWEAMLTLMRINLILSKGDDDESRRLRTDTTLALRRLYVQWGDKTGGRRFGPAFAQLRKDLAADAVPTTN